MTDRVYVTTPLVELAWWIARGWSLARRVPFNEGLGWSALVWRETPIGDDRKGGPE